MLRTLSLHIRSRLFSPLQPEKSFNRKIWLWSHWLPLSGSCFLPFSLIHAPFPPCFTPSIISTCSSNKYFLNMGYDGPGCYDPRVHLNFNLSPHCSQRLQLHWLLSGPLSICAPFLLFPLSPRPFDLPLPSTDIYSLALYPNFLP